MQRINFSIFINAPREKVWNTMLTKETYEEWTKPFNPTSTFVGDWSVGSKMIFTGTNDEGKDIGGMSSRIEKNIPNEYLSIQHVGFIKDGIEDTTSDEVKKWTPAFENYILTDKDGGTELSIELDTPDEYKAQFEEMWPNSLKLVKEWSEK